MATETDVVLPDGRTLHAYDTGSGSLPVFWLHGTPNVGSPPRPLFPLSEPLGIRWLGYDRPGYGGSTARPGRNIASAAADVAAVADALGVDTFAVVGHSGGAPHALGCAALLPDRVRAAVAVSGYVPYGTPGVDWFAGMSDATSGALHAALAGREEKERYEATVEAEDPGFTAADLDALAHDWSWFLEVVRPALVGGPGPLIDDDLALVGPGDSTSPRSGCRCSCCTAARTGWRRSATRPGWPSTARPRRCRSARPTGTSRCSARPGRRWTGSPHTPAEARAQSIEDGARPGARRRTAA